MKARILLGSIALMLAAASTAGVQAPSAVAATSRASALPAPGVSSTALSSWQTNSTVWAIAQANGVVYVGGQFTSVRPPGDPAGTGETPRTYLAAFSAATGALMTSFDPVITGTSSASVYALAVSPDGKTLYVGGLFSGVNGLYRDNLAALSTATGAPTSWAPSAYGQVNSIAVSSSGSAIYLGGSFNELGTAGSGPGLQARTYAGAVDTSGTLLAWAPVLDNSVTSVAVAPDGSQVLVGGYFATINGVSQPGAGAVDPTTGATTVPWTANIVPDNSRCAPPAVKTIVISGSTAYLGSEGTGGGCFDGDFAVTLGSTDKLLWQNDCLGATQALVVINGYLFKGSHAHDCAYAQAGFPQNPENMSGPFVPTYHLLDQSLNNGVLSHWTPNTSATVLGPRVMATDGSQLFLGGDFTTVNDQPQQGFAIFPAGAGTTAPSAPAAPTVTSTSAGVASLTFTGVSSPEFGTLTYTVYRVGRTIPIGTVTATSYPWALPVVHYREASLPPGSQWSWTVTASDGTHTSAQSPASAPVTIQSKNPASSYVTTVLNDKPSFFWRLDQTSGSTAADSSPHGFTGKYEPGTTLGYPGPITGVTGTSTWFNGSTGLVTATQKVQGPASFSVEGWFKTTTVSGGKLVGFGSSQTGRSSSYDRHIYMMNDGQLVFGVTTPQRETIESPNVYNDGQWHYAVATFAATATSGTMALYVDGHLIGTQATGPPQIYAGYWRVGGDNLNGWNLDAWGNNSQGTTEPYSYYFYGSIGDVAVYPIALSPARVAAHYAANAQEH
jgi:hypothetical protein